MLQWSLSVGEDRFAVAVATRVCHDTRADREAEPLPELLYCKSILFLFITYFYLSFHVNVLSNNRY